MKTAKILFPFLFLFLSCGNVNLRYSSKVELDNGKTGDFVYYKSYEVKTLKTVCIITGIIYGGACWFYLGLPDARLREEIRKDAQEKLKTMIQVPFKETNEDVVRMSWEQTQAIGFLNGIEEGKNMAPVQTPVKKEEAPKAVPPVQTPGPVATPVNPTQFLR